MFRALKAQFLVLAHHTPFWISAISLFSYSVFAFYVELFTYKGVELSTIPGANALFLLLHNSRFYPFYATLASLLLVLPFSTSYVTENKRGAIWPVINRLGRKNYFLSKTIVCYIATFSVFFGSLLINLFLCNIAFPHNCNVLFGEYNMPNYFRTLLGTNLLYRSVMPEHPFLKLYIYSPLLYNVFYALLFASLMAFLSTIVISFSYLYSKKLYVLFFPIFIFLYISQALQFAALNNALQNGGDEFLNFNVFDYVTPMATTGQSIYFILCFIAITLMFIVISHIIVVRRE